MLFPSKYNHLVQVEPAPGTEAYLLTNLLFGASGFVDRSVYDALCDGESQGYIDEDRLNPAIAEHLEARGYLWSDQDDEEKMLGNASAVLGDRDFLAAGLQGGHYGFITSLFCNLACPYCFQKDNADSCGFLTPRQVDLGIEAIERAEERAAAHANGNATTPKVSITGGEPLLRNRANKDVLQYLIESLEAKQWPYSITTNGTELASFIDGRRPPSNCRNIQVTLDGPRSVHDRRRYFRDHGPSFDLICQGLDLAILAGWPMTLRVNLDASNVGYLPELADFVKDQGWPGCDNFYAYVSPVTDHGPLGDQGNPADEADLLTLLLGVISEAPAVREVFDIRHFRGFDYVERMFARKDPKFPVLYRCEAVMGMFIFDPNGDTHVCLEAVGNRNLRVGVYDPEWRLDDEAFSKWTRRNVLSMQECRACKVRFVCAGGCTIESFNHGGEPCCMPFLREMDIAWEYFAKTQPELFA